VSGDAARSRSILSAIHPACVSSFSSRRRSRGLRRGAGGEAVGSTSIEAASSLWLRRVAVMLVSLWRWVVAHNPLFQSLEKVKSSGNIFRKV